MSEDSKPPSVLAALPLGCGPPYNGIRLSANSGPAPDRPLVPVWLAPTRIHAFHPLVRAISTLRYHCIDAVRYRFCAIMRPGITPTVSRRFYTAAARTLILRPLQAFVCPGGGGTFLRSIDPEAVLPLSRV